MRASLLLAAILLQAGCSATPAPPPGDAGSDGGLPDAGFDGGVDGGRDGGFDSGSPATDAGFDAGSGANLTNACADGRLVCGTPDPVGIAGPDGGILPLQFHGQPALHFFCYPASGSGISPNGMLLVHLVGTGSDPAVDHDFELEACVNGFAAIGPMYENQSEVTATCQGLGADQDACYTEVHEAVIYGNSYPLPGGTTPATFTPADSIGNRTATLLAYLAGAQPAFAPWATFSSEFAQGNATHVVLAGHSQGSGHSLYWSKRLAPSREIMLSGPPDRIHMAGGGTGTPTWVPDSAPTRGSAQASSTASTT